MAVRGLLVLALPPVLRGAGSAECNGVYVPDPDAKEKMGHRMEGSKMRRGRLRLWDEC